MKVKTLSRSVQSTERECSGDIRKHHRNIAPLHHPMQRAREYTRAVTAAKLDRMFAKPFIGSLGNGHVDSITAAATCRTSLVPFVSGAADGTIRLWDLASRQLVDSKEGAHTRIVTGLVFDAIQGQYYYSCSDDGLVKQWSITNFSSKTSSNDASNNNSTNNDNDHPDNNNNPQKKKSWKGSADQSQQQLPVANQVWRTPGSFKSIDHNWHRHEFATASDEAVCLWDPNRSTPIQTHSDLWGSQDTVTLVRYHPVESHLLAHVSADRGVGFHDTRTATGLTKCILQMRSNCLEWNPMEPMNLIVGNEDYQAYLFDMRNFQRPLRIYKGHVGAIVSISWSPTGRDFCTGSYDRTIRLFDIRHNTSRDVYHTKRMQRVMTVNYSMDAKFVISGSDDTNVRLWKAHASESLQQATYREESSLRYRQALVQKYQHLPEVARIVKSRKIPKTIQKQTAQAILQKESAERKQGNRIKYAPKHHNAAAVGNASYKFVSERAKTVLKQL